MTQNAFSYLLQGLLPCTRPRVAKVVCKTLISVILGICSESTPTPSHHHLPVKGWRIVRISQYICANKQAQIMDKCLNGLFEGPGGLRLEPEWFWAWGSFGDVSGIGFCEAFHSGLFLGFVFFVKVAFCVPATLNKSCFFQKKWFG